MKKIELNQMENLNGGGRPECSWSYAASSAAMCALVGGPLGLAIFAGTMLYCN